MALSVGLAVAVLRKLQFQIVVLLRLSLNELLQVSVTLSCARNTRIKKA